MLILSGCSGTYLEKLNLKKWNGESDFVSYVKNNQADRRQWYRTFIAKCLSLNSVNFYSYLQKCQGILFAEQYLDDFKALSKKFADSCGKKEKKSEERLKELDNDNTEEAQWFPLFIDALMKMWADEQLAIPGSKYPTADLKELARRLDKTLSVVRTKALIRKLRRPPRVSFQNSERLDKLKKLYPNHTNEEIAQILDIIYSAVNGIALRLWFSRSKEFRFQCISKSSFPKGH